MTAIATNAYATLIMHETQSTRGYSHSLVNWHIKETLNLRSVQIHCLKNELGQVVFAGVTTHNNMVASSFLDHIRDQFCSDRRSTLVLFILSRIWEKRNDCCNPHRAGNLARMDHDA